MDLYIYGKSSDTWPDLVCPQPSTSPSLWNLLAGRMLAQLDFWYDGDGDNYNYDDHTEKEEGDKDKKT